LKVLLFDLDGTLVRTSASGRKALARAVEDVHGVRPRIEGSDLAGQTDLRNFQEAIRRATGKKPDRAGIERVHRRYLQLLPRYVRDSVRRRRYKVMPGLRRLLGLLRRDQGVLLGLGTGNMEQGARIKLEPSGLNPCFPFGGFGSDRFRRPALLKVAVERARRRGGGGPIRKRDVFVIGDTPLDVSAGKAAGFRTVAVGTGFSDWESLVLARPDHLAKDYSNTEDWLRWFAVRPRRKKLKPRSARRRG